MVPGAASRGFVTPMSPRTTFQVSGPPSITIATSGPRGDERDEVAEERTLAVLVVVTTGEVGIDGAQLEGDDREALALEAADDLSDQSTFDGIGLAEDEGAVGDVMAR